LLGFLNGKPTDFLGNHLRRGQSTQLAAKWPFFKKQVPPSIDQRWKRQPMRRKQGCQMAYFQPKNPNLGKFWRFLKWRCCYILCPFGTFYSNLVYFMPIWYTLLYYQGKSGNPARRSESGFVLVFVFFLIVLIS
jgi:hypothetical protein